MQKEVKAVRSQPKKGGIHRITIDKAANGFSVQAHHEPPANGMLMGPSDREKPAVFTKHSAAKKHVAGLMQQMHPDLPGTGPMGSPASATMEDGEAPVETNP